MQAMANIAISLFAGRSHCAPFFGVCHYTLGVCQTNAYIRVVRMPDKKYRFRPISFVWCKLQNLSHWQCKYRARYNGIKEDMTVNDMMAEIRDANLSYLMLAQQMVRSDKATAIFRLGLSKDIADLIGGMSTAQILKLAGSNMMLARFRFDDSAILGMLTKNNKDRALAQSHAAILMAGQPIEEIA
jgi:flagellar transcriptional activator FlhD